MSLYSILLHFHSAFRYVALAFLLISIVISLKKKFQLPLVTPLSLKIPLFTLISFHIQFLSGLLLFIISPKVQFSKSMMQVDIFRFFTMEHSIMMLIAIALVTVGYSRAKRNLTGKGDNQILIYYGLTLLVLLFAIPWPFRQMLGSGWF